MDFESLYRKHRGALYQLAVRILGDPDLAADAVQDSFMKAYRSQESFKGDSRPLTWLYRITYNHCLDRLRSRTKGAAGLGDLDPADAEGTRPESAVARDETRRQVHAALSLLSEDDRHLLYLMMEKDLSHRELSLILRCPLPSLRMRVCRARQRLRKELESLLGERS